MKPRRLLINVLTALPVAAAIAAMCFAPDSVPMHYNTAGEADRWGSRWSLLLYPLIALIMRLVLAGLSKLVSKDKNGESYVGYMSIATIGVMLTFDILALYSIYVAVVPGVAMDSAAVNERMCQAAVIATGICLIPVGRDLRDIPYNKNVGIKTKWSLANEEAWSLSQRFGGNAFIAAGAAMAVLALFLPGLNSLWAALGVIIIMCVADVIYSRKAYLTSVRGGGGSD